MVDTTFATFGPGRELILDITAAEYARDAPTAAAFADATVPSAVPPPSGYSLSKTLALQNLCDFLGSPVSCTTTRLGQSPPITSPTIYAPVARKPVDTLLSSFRLTLFRIIRSASTTSTSSGAFQPSSAPAAPRAHNFGHEMSALAAISSIQQQVITVWPHYEARDEGKVG